MTNFANSRTSAWIISKCAPLSRLARNDAGVAAVEFALIAPILITLFLGAVEFSQAITVDRKLTALASSTADLVAQTEEIDDTEMANIFQASTAILTPYSTATLTVIVTGITIDGSGAATVTWSDTYQGTARSVGSTVTLPAALVVNNTCLVMSETTYNFSSVVGQFLTSGVNMDDTFYLRPRASDCVVRL
jgi:Flp pilus assembly protein TadG